MLSSAAGPIAPAGIEALPEDDVFLLEDAPSPQVTRPGCYRGVCVHLKLHHLAVAAVDQVSSRPGPLLRNHTRHCPVPAHLGLCVCP
jgi:hypothetical protein